MTSMNLQMRLQNLENMFDLMCQHLDAIAPQEQPPSLLSMLFGTTSIAVPTASLLYRNASRHSSFSSIAFQDILQNLFIAVFIMFAIKFIMDIAFMIFGDPSSSCPHPQEDTTLVLEASTLGFLTPPLSSNNSSSGSLSTPIQTPTPTPITSTPETPHTENNAEEMSKEQDSSNLRS